MNMLCFVIEILSSQLTTFARLVSSLGRPVKLVQSLTLLSDQLELVMFLFRGNAAALFPQKVKVRSERQEYFNMQSTAKYDLAGFSPEAMPSQVVLPYDASGVLYLFYCVAGILGQCRRGVSPVPHGDPLLP
jgi:hypothetical protein